MHFVSLLLYFRQYLLFRLINFLLNIDPKTGPKRQMRRLLKKEVSLDTYTWQKKYAHLTSNLVIPAVDERFKRRFSVSASMEEISKIPQNKEGQVSTIY